MSSHKRFYTTSDLQSLLRVSSRTLARRRSDRVNPLPAPKIIRAGSANLYCVDEIEAYIERSIQLSTNPRQYYFQCAENAAKQ